MDFRNDQFETSPKKWRAAAITMSILFVGALGALLYFNADFRGQQEMANAQLESVESQRVELADELSGLVEQYELQISDNEVLKDSLTTQLAEVEDLQAKVRNAEYQLIESKAGSNKIKSQLEELEKVKANLELAIVSLTEENETLVTANDALKEVLVQAEADIELLEEQTLTLTASNEKLISRLSQIAPAGFTAENFVVTTRKKNSRLTNKAARTDVINVAFNIDNVPGNYKSNHEIYLVFTDAHGNPVESFKMIDATIKTGENSWPIQAAMTETLLVDSNQLIEMSISPDDDLDPGTYNLMVYADNGYLGSTGFSLK